MNIYRYSTSFKKSVIQELDTGLITVSALQRKYGCSRSSILKWHRKYGKNYKIGKVIKVEKAGERDKLKELEGEVLFLKKELREARIGNIVWEAVVEEASKVVGFDVKKKFADKVSPLQSKRVKQLIK